MAETGDDTVEEKKMIDESRKILEIPDLKISVTCVRLPILGGHAESVNIELNDKFDMGDVKRILSDYPGIIVLDNMKNEVYPTPALSSDTNPVYVGRIRRDHSVPYGFNIWVVADNLRKGAATNAVQIAEILVKEGLLSFDRIDFN